MASWLTDVAFVDATGTAVSLSKVASNELIAVSDK